MFNMVETFSGIGSQVKALNRLKKDGIEYEILHTADWDINAIIAYDLIHNGKQDLIKYEKISKEDILLKLDKFTLSLDGKKPASKNVIKNLNYNILTRLLCAIERTKNLISITDIKGEDLPNEMNLLTYSFPCQDLSVAGFWHGNKGGISRDANNRSSMLWQVERILKERHEKKLTMPQFLLMENVRNISDKQHKENFEEWQSSLKSMGYTNKIYKLDASNFGIPQKRVRLYMISILTNSDANLEKRINNYFDAHDLRDIEYVKTLKRKQKNLNSLLCVKYEDKRYRDEANHSQPNDTKSRKAIFDNNVTLYNGKDTLTEIVSTITTKQDRHPNSGIIAYKDGIKGKSQFRYLTPRECFLLMGFDEKDYQIIVDNNFTARKGNLFFTRDKLNKMAGNSIVVDVLEEIFRQMKYIDEHIFDSNN